MSMQTTGDNDSGEPMMDINMTPLIDVMLVLLIMFIITIPIQTHAVKLDLPQNTNNASAADRPDEEQGRDHRRRARSCGTAAPVTHDQLRQYLEVTQQMNPIPELHLQPEADRALRAGRPGARGHQAGACREDGLRRQRILYEHLLTGSVRRSLEGGS